MKLERKKQKKKCLKEYILKGFLVCFDITENILFSLIFLSIHTGCVFFQEYRFLFVFKQTKLAYFFEFYFWISFLLNS